METPNRFGLRGSRGESLPVKEDPTDQLRRWRLIQRAMHELSHSKEERKTLGLLSFARAAMLRRLSLCFGTSRPCRRISAAPADRRAPGADPSLCSVPVAMPASTGLLPDPAAVVRMEPAAGSGGSGGQGVRAMGSAGEERLAVFALVFSSTCDSVLRLYCLLFYFFCSSVP